MSMMEWAEREVEIACKRENPNRKEGEWDYGCACYESALKAYKSLEEDGHSGFSFSLTKQILNRLMNGTPLTPIEDTDDIWRETTPRHDEDRKIYQCLRMSSFFKDVYEDGTVIYDDINRILCVNIDNPNLEYHNGLVRREINKMFPITMPYAPDDKPHKAYCEEILTDSRYGDFDTICILHVITPDGFIHEINRYFKAGNDDWVEIDYDEWAERVEMHNARLDALNAERSR